MSDIKKLRDELVIMSKYGSALGVLNWDQEVNIPKKGHAFRGEVNALLSADLHNRFTSKEFVGLVKKLHEPATFEKLSPDDKVIVRETYKDVEKSLKIPTEMVEQMARLATEAFGAWAEAREKFSLPLAAEGLGGGNVCGFTEARSMHDPLIIYL